MTQKQIVGVVAGVAVMVLVCTLVYRQYTSDTGRTEKTVTSESSVPIPKKGATSDKGQVAEAPIPDTIEGIADSIVEESSVDFSALDEEESSSLSDVDEDSESVNNLGTSYDENNL
jgi:hypothetical protein